MRTLVTVFLFSLGVCFAYGQEVMLSADSLENASYEAEQETSASVVTKKLHSPKRATIYEALVPGLGHIYNKKIWHLPIVYAAFGTTIYLIVDNTKKYEKYKNAYADFTSYRKFLMQEPQFPLPITEPKSQRFRKILDIDYSELDSERLGNFERAFKNNKDAFRRYRDLSYISLVGVYILNVIWATVDAHFFYYDVSEDLSLHLQPKLFVMEDNREGFAVNLVFNF